MYPLSGLKRSFSGCWRSGRLDADDSLEAVIASRGRFKILRLLSQVHELNISEIAKRAGVPYISADRHLMVLKRSGIVEEKSFGRIRIFRFRDEDRRCQAVRRFLAAWQSA